MKQVLDSGQAFSDRQLAQRMGRGVARGSRDHTGGRGGHDGNRRGRGADNGARGASFFGGHAG